MRNFMQSWYVVSEMRIQQLDELKEKKKVGKWNANIEHSKGKLLRY